MVKSDEMRRGIRVLKKRRENYEDELNKLSQIILEKKQKLKSLRKIINQGKRELKEAETDVRIIEICEIIKWKKQERIEIREMLNEKELETKLIGRISKIKNQVIPKWELRLKERNAKNVRKLKMRVLKPIITFKKQDDNNVADVRKRRKTLSEMTNEELVHRCDPGERDRARVVVDKLRQYLNQVRSSQGFDVDEDVFPGVFFGVTTVMPLKENGGAFGSGPIDYKWMGNFALSKYNARHKTKFEYVKLLKTNVIVNQYSTFYITFLAQDKMKMNEVEPELRTFQARVGCDMMFPKFRNSCSLVRLKPN